MKLLGKMVAFGLASLLLLPVSATYAQKTRESLPKLLPVREQQAVREEWLKKRLDTMLLPLMRQQKVDMWIVTSSSFRIAVVTNSSASLSFVIPKSTSSTSLNC